MWNVPATTVSQPPSAISASTAVAAGCSVDHTVPPSGRHAANSRMSAPLANNTYVLRSIGGGTSFVHIRLKPGRAMPLCCSANRPSKSASITNASPIGAPSPPRSMVLGTSSSPSHGSRRMFPTKPIAYRNVPRKIAYTATL